MNTDERAHIILGLKYVYVYYIFLLNLNNFVMLTLIYVKLRRSHLPSSLYEFTFFYEVLTPLLKFYLVYSSILQLKNNWLI